jgi:uncharacterized membrane protein YebE (DUF533 family)
MFLTGFNKIAVTLVTMTPEEYYDVVREKDPFVGATAGGLGGAILGAIKSKKGSKHKGALLGSGVGAATGALSTYGAGKALRQYQAGKVRRMAEDLHLKSSPGRAGSHQ